MQVTPTVGREWATETGMRELERTMAANPHAVLRDPEQNIRVGCWYLEKIREQFQDVPDPDSRVIAAYNAGPSRAVEWGKGEQEGKVLTTDEFIARIDIPSTRAYVISVLDRYRKLKTARGQVRL
jgi:soluble lytic murein transglycosylase